MYAKLVVLTVCLFLIGGALLVQRQQRLHLAHEIMTLRRESDRTRRVIWTHQAEAAEQLTPRRIGRMIDSVSLVLEPATPLWDQPSGSGWRYAAVEGPSGDEVRP